MGYIKTQPMAALCAAFVVFFAACSGNATQENKTAAKDTLAKPRWIDPQKGKIYGKVNFVQIPLTAIEQHIQGPVNTVTYKDYKISEKDGSKTLDDSGYNVYDKFGHLIDQNEYNADGTAKWQCIYKYDSNNKAVQYDLNLKHLKAKSIVTFKYDDKGRKIEEDDISDDKRFSGKTLYKYDDKGNLIEEAIYRSGSGTAWITDYGYDSRGFQTGCTLTNGDKKILRKETKEYDGQGNDLKGIYYENDTVISGRWVAINDNKGRTIQRTDYKAKDSIVSITKYKYDDWDNVIENITCKPDGSIDTARWNSYTDYEYDARGNVVKQTEYKLRSGKKVPAGYTETRYTYY